MTKGLAQIGGQLAMVERSKVLCLHGNRQTGEIFKQRIARLVKACNAKAHRDQFPVEFTFVDAPNLLPLEAGDDVNYRTWWWTDQNGIAGSDKFSPDSLEKSLGVLETLYDQHKFDGIIGFSLGGMLASIMTVQPDRFPGLKWMCVAGSGFSQSPDMATLNLLFDPFVTKTNNVQSNCIELLMYAGEHDALVPATSSKLLFDTLIARGCISASSQFHMHEQGHVFPTKAIYCQQVIDLLQRHHPGQSLDDNKAINTFGVAVETEISKFGTSKANGALEHGAVDKYVIAETVPIAAERCCSDENAHEQQDEIEALEAIYENFLKVIQPAPQASGEPCAKFSLKLFGIGQNGELDPERQRVVDSWVNGGLSLVCTCPGKYPSDEPLRVSLDTQLLSSVQLPLDLEREMVRLVTEEAKRNVGGASAFSCINVLEEYILTGTWERLLTASTSSAKATQSCTSQSKDGNQEEDQSCSNLNQDSDFLARYREAFQDRLAGIVNEDKEAECIARVARLALDADEQETTSTESITEPTSGVGSTTIAGNSKTVSGTIGSKKGGVWQFVLGVVGKPSVGKSTFFNALVKMKDVRRKGASVAPHPFTTIEPNISTAWWAAPVLDLDTGPNRCSAHGRDAIGRRLLPVLVKDVAGLVPGAYRGLGKGNKFLNDLVDADALVHVIDGSGQSDKQGNIIVDQVNDTSGSQNTCSTPEQDAEWVAQELHRWIFNNVMAKWQGCIRRAKSRGLEDPHAVGDRVVELLSGYRSKRWMVEKAAKRAGLVLDDAAMWTAADLHLMVANFLVVRFPICLALNKVDAATPERLDLVDEMVSKRNRNQAEQGTTGSECAVAMSATVEIWLLQQAAAGTLEYRPGSPSVRLLPDGSMLLKDTSSRGLKFKAELERAKSVLERYQCTGVLEAVSRAVALRNPVLVYPVSDLDTEVPVIGVTGSQQHASNLSIGEADVGEQAMSSIANKVLLDCLQMLPNSTAGDVYSALSRGVLGHTSIQGDFVRAEARSLNRVDRKRQIGKGEEITSDNCVLRIMTNRKSVWQQAKRLAALEKQHSQQ